MSHINFKKYLVEAGLGYEIVISELPTRTAQEAAKVHQVPVSNIVKSLLIKANDDYLLFLVPGDRKLDVDEIKIKLGVEKLRLATADEVKDQTGYSIGGVPPFGHKNLIQTYVYEGFNEKDILVAAAGAGNAVFKISLTELVKELQRSLCFRHL